jgi:hypothetical protein
MSNFGVLYSQVLFSEILSAKLFILSTSKVFYAHLSVHRESIFKKRSNKMTLFCTVFYSLQTALHVSGETFTHHQELE